MEVFVSIITPMYNSESYVEEMIRSVQAQTYKYWELIVTDDGSTDDSYRIVEELAREDKRIILNRRDLPPKGGSACRNIGIDMSRGDYLMFLDSDDLLYPSCLENRLKVMKNESVLDFAVFQMDMLLPTGEYNGTCTKEYDNYLHAFLSYKLPWTTAASFWKSSFYKDKIVGFDVRFPRLQDPEMHTRALLTEEVCFEVLPLEESKDCSYRVDYKPVNLGNFLKGVDLYVSTFSEKIKGRMDEIECKQSLAAFYDTAIGYYTEHSKGSIYSNCSLMKIVNRTFFVSGIISKKKYRKTSLFLTLLKYQVFESSLLVRLLYKLGFTNFYSFNILKFKNRP